MLSREYGRPALRYKLSLVIDIFGEWWEIADGRTEFGAMARFSMVRALCSVQGGIDNI
jgi:hypothetical protein